MTTERLFRLTSLLAFALFVGLMVAPQLIIALFGMDPAPEAEVMARRAALLFAAIGLIYRRLSTSKDAATITTLLMAGFVLMTTLALLGLTEWILARVGIGILVAVITEAVFATLFVRALRGRG